MKKEYSNGELTIVWRLDKCIHSGVCVKTLPDVYKPKEKPWINQENAKTEQLVRQIDNCPSGALSYYFNSDEESGVFRDNVEKKRYELEITGQTAFIEYIIAKNGRILTLKVPGKICWFCQRSFLVMAKPIIGTDHGRC